MQWQDKPTSLIKDKLEWEACRKYRKTCPHTSLLK
jgi:hypothetical protein